MTDTPPRCPRCDSSDCPAAAIEWVDASAYADGWATVAEDDEQRDRHRRRSYPTQHGCVGALIDWRTRARALEAEVERLKAALERILEIERECPTWWDDPVQGVGAVARAALEKKP